MIAGAAAGGNREIGPMHAETIAATTGETGAVYRVPKREALPARARLPTGWAVQEDGEYYVPDFLSADPFQSRPRTYRAANEHAGDLRDAGQQLADVLNLALVLRGSVQADDDSRAMQADTVLKIIEEKLCMAHRLIDRHDARHLNLFLAYFDLKKRAGERSDD